MAIKLVTDWRTLFALASALGQARLRGDPEEIRRAQEAHDHYRDMCLRADEMIGLDLRTGEQK